MNLHGHKIEFLEFKAVLLASWPSVNGLAPELFFFVFSFGATPCDEGKERRIQT